MGRKKSEIIEKEITEKQPENIQKEFQKFIRKMVREYGSMEGFKKAYIKSLIEGNNIVPRKLRHIFISCLDLNQPDYICREKSEYMNLLSAIYNDSISLVINTENFDNMWKEAMKKLSTKEKNVIINHFGLNGEIKTLQEIADEYKVTKERIRQVEENALNKFREEKCMRIFAPYVDDVIEPNNEEKIINEFFKVKSIFVDDSDNEISEEKMAKFKQLVKTARINHEIKSENLNQIMQLPKVKRGPIVDYTFPEKVIVPKLKYLSKRAKKRYKGERIIDTADVIDLKEEIPKDVLIAIYKQVAESEKAKRYRNKVNRISTTIKYHPDELIKKNPQLIELGINDRICKILENDNIKTLSDLLSYSIYDLRQMGSLSKHNITTIVQKIHRYGFVIEDENVDKEIVEEKISRAKAKKLPIEEARFSTRTLLSLKRAGINTFADLTDYSAEEIMRIKNIGENSVKEIIYVLNSYNLKLSEEPTKSRKNGKRRKILELSEDNYRVETKTVDLLEQEKKKEEIHTEAYDKAMKLFIDFCNAENNVEQKNEIKNEINVLFQDLDECEQIKIRAKIYKKIKDIGKDLDNTKER